MESIDSPFASPDSSPDEKQQNLKSKVAGPTSKRSGLTLARKISALTIGTARLKIKEQIESRIDALKRQRARAEQEVKRLNIEVVNLEKERNRFDTATPKAMSQICLLQ